MRQGEKGFTLIEVIIGAAILGIIMPAITMTTTALMTNHQSATDPNIVLDQVQNAGRWISHDVQMAKTVIFDDPTGFPLTLIIPVDTDENNDRKVIYLFDNDKLKRQGYDSSETLIAEILIAGYIDTQDTTFSIRGSNVYELAIKANKNETVVQRTYEIVQRVGSR